MKEISRRDFLKVMGGAAAGAILAKSGLPHVSAQAPVVGSVDETGKKRRTGKALGPKCITPNTSMQPISLPCTIRSVKESMGKWL